jgi:hypothetical protein
MKPGNGKISQTGIGLTECLITLMIFSLVSVNASVMLLESLRTLGYINNQMVAARLAADASVLTDFVPAELQKLSEQAAQTLPQGQLTVTAEGPELHIKITWAEPGSYGQQTYLLRQYAG